MEKSKTPKEKHKESKEEIIEEAKGAEEQKITEQEIKKDDTPEIVVPSGWRPKTIL